VQSDGARALALRWSSAGEAYQFDQGYERVWHAQARETLARREIFLPTRHGVEIY
jgi:hypothetical protein